MVFRLASSRMCVKLSNLQQMRVCDHSDASQAMHTQADSGLRPHRKRTSNNQADGPCSQAATPTVIDVGVRVPPLCLNRRQQLGRVTPYGLVHQMRREASDGDGRVFDECRIVPWVLVQLGKVSLTLSTTVRVANDSASTAGLEGMGATACSRGSQVLEVRTLSSDG